MTHWRRLVTTAGVARVVALLGGLYVTVAGVMALHLVASGTPLLETLGRFVLLASLGSVLLYGSYRLSGWDVHPDAKPWIVTWTVAGFGVMALVVVTMETISPSGVDNPAFAVPLATALGSVGGFAVGVQNARARTRERELEESVERLRAANERLEQFAHAASHDLQEPLRMVSSYLQLLERRNADSLDEDAREYLEFAVDGADRMRRMIDAVLQYSRVETRGGAFEPVELDGVLADALEDLHLAARESDADVTADPLPRVVGDPDQLRQVFQNLLQNAIEYSGDGPSRVHVSADRDGSEWVVSVADDGIGIDPEYHEKVFEPFERLQVAGETQSGGIGLALCQRIVERHGGEIWIESAPGEGTTVCFTLPAADDDRSFRPNSAATEPGTGDPVGVSGS